MDKYTIAEQAYKNGYDKGCEESKAKYKKILQIVGCECFNEKICDEYDDKKEHEDLILVDEFDIELAEAMFSKRELAKLYVNKLKEVEQLKKCINDNKVKIYEQN